MDRWSQRRRHPPWQPRQSVPKRRHVKEEGTQVSQPNANTTDHQDEPQRAILPIPDVTPPGLTTYDAKDPEAEFPPIRELRPPEGAPNVLVILLDDVGFG